MARPFAVSAEEREVTVDTGRARLGATLGLPHDARGMVMFAHGSGSSRHSERNRSVAEQLRGAEDDRGDDGAKVDCAGDAEFRGHENYVMLAMTT